MSLLEAIRGPTKLRHSAIQRDASAPLLQGQFDSISKEYDTSVLHCNIEYWAPLLGQLTFETSFVPLTQGDAEHLIAAYADLERRPDAIPSLQADPTPLNAHESALRASLCPGLQSAIDALSEPGSDSGCFVKLSSRSPKDAAARSGALEAFYAAALAHAPDGALADPETKLRIVCEAEGAALRFTRAEDVVRALVLSERVWQDMTLALRHPEIWRQNVVVRRWAPVEIDMEFRMFVHRNKLTAISQYAYQLHSPRLVTHQAELRAQLCGFYEGSLRQVLSAGGFGTCVIDVAVLSLTEGSSCVVEINPFLPTTDGGLFSWESELLLLEGVQTGVEYPVIRVNERARAGALVMVPRGWKDVMSRVESRCATTRTNNA